MMTKQKNTLLKVVKTTEICNCLLYTINKIKSVGGQASVRPNFVPGAAPGESETNFGRRQKATKESQK
eukprot:2688887-Amphidinium_carterae.1